MNDFYINYNAPPAKTDKSVIIEINGKRTEHLFTIDPARKITFYLIPHAHVDIGYTDLQTEVEKKHWDNIEKAIEFSKKSRDYPEGSLFKWNVEVLWAVKSYLEQYPEKRTGFLDAVKKGWIGLDATYVNVMTALCRPEELYRLVDYSNRLEKETGINIESAMISDIPGYTWGTVQAFADNGIKYFSVGPNEFDRIGNTLKIWGDKPFYWRSPSGGKRILVWMAAKGYSWFHRWRLTRDEISPIAKYLDELDKVNYPYDMVHVRYNIGGDNGFPDSSLSHFVYQWNESHETPKFKIATTSEMFKDFEKKYQKQIPEYGGDFTPYWEDGAGSTARETALNRRTAELLTQLEILYTLTNRTDYPSEIFNEAWKYVLLFSEHTWGAWNSISEPELKSVKNQWNIKKSYSYKADSLAQKLYNDFAFRKSVKNDSVESITVWNSSSWKRSDLVTVSPEIKSAGGILVDSSGKQIPTQRLSTGEIVFIAEDVPALGFKKFRFVKKFSGNISSEPEKLAGNDWISTVLTKELASFFDKNSYGFNEFISTGRNASNKKFGGQSSAAPKEIGPVVNSIQFKSVPPGTNGLLSEVRSFRTLNKIEILNNIDKKKVFEKENIRFAFPFNIKNPVNRMDLAWSVIQPEKDQLEGANKNYFTLQRWIDISDEKRGITLATIDAPFVEIGGMNAEDWIKPEGQDWAAKTSSSSKIFSWVMNNSWHTNFHAAQEGPVLFKYALRIHDKFSYIDSYRFGVEQSQQLIAAFGDLKEEDTSPIPLLNENTDVVITSIRPSYNRNSIILRLYNPTDKLSIAVLDRYRKPESIIYLSNGDEDELKVLNEPLRLKPYEVITLKISDVNPVR